MNLLLSTLVALLLLASPSSAQVGMVTSAVHLRANPNFDDSTLVIRTLHPPEAFTLRQPKEQGNFYHVRTENGENGWVSKAHVSIYSRSDWKHWIDADGDCQDTRHEVLIEESTIPVTLSQNGCRVTAGRWEDPYSGEVFTNPSDLDVDHVVPLAHAHVSGGWAWNAERKKAYANDLTNPNHLIAVKDNLNQQKGDKAPDNWKPPRQEFWCQYATIWLDIKHRWGLTLTASEASAVADMKRTCP